jgi:ribosomal protein L3 glutamine methyltransferase
MVTVGEYVERTSAVFDGAELFYGHGTDNAFDEAVYLVFATLDIAFDDPEAYSRVIARDECDLLDSRVADRVENHTPVAYLVGQAWFGGMRFIADARALIPRSPLAEFIAEGCAPFVSYTPERILDLCCGGGCIGILAAHQFPLARVDLADLSADALALARENVSLHTLADRVNLRQSNLFEALEGRYDLMLSNPPYVPLDEVLGLPPEYSHEPSLGLISEDDGLAIPLQILREAPDYLSDGGVLVMEVGYSVEQLSARLAQVPLLWLEFAHGGEGVLAITRDELLRYRDQFK